MDWPERFLVGHMIAVFFAVFSILVLIPYPETWTFLPGANYSYKFAMDYFGALHILLGAAAMFAFLWRLLGSRAAWQSLVAAVGLSLSFELLGTGTGWPFGNYEYTSGLGYKVLGRVPYAIPLSWFYLASSSFLLAATIVDRLLPRAGTAGAVVLGTWLLTAWDLVLDPAMAHPDMPMKFWVWHEQGAYLGMPLINLAGWALTGTLIMGVTRLAWGRLPTLSPSNQWFPYAVYVTNMVFGGLLCASVGLWWPILLAVLAGIAPASLIWSGYAPSAPPAGV